MLTRLIDATVMSTASLIALSGHASVWADCICSAISGIRRWKSGSLKKLPKPSMAQLYWWQRPRSPTRSGALRSARGRAGNGSPAGRGATGGAARGGGEGCARRQGGDRGAGEGDRRRRGRRERLRVPARHPPAQRGEGHDARGDREPEGEGAVAEHGNDGQAGVHPEGGEGADHP